MDSMILFQSGNENYNQIQNSTRLQRVFLKHEKRDQDFKIYLSRIKQKRER